MQKEGNNRLCVCVCVRTRGLRSKAWADGPQRCYLTVSGHCDWCIATSKKVEHLAADPQSELIGPAFSLFSCCWRADGWFGRNKHTLGTQHFPTLKGACMGCARWKLLPRLCKEVRMVVQEGRMGERSHGDERRRHTGSRGYCVTLGWRRSDLELIPRGLVSGVAPYDLISASNNSSYSSQVNFIHVAQYHKFASRGFTICAAHDTLCP